MGHGHLPENVRLYGGVLYWGKYGIMDCLAVKKFCWSHITVSTRNPDPPNLTVQKFCIPQSMHPLVSHWDSRYPLNNCVSQNVVSTATSLWTGGSAVWFFSPPKLPRPMLGTTRVQQMGREIYYLPHLVAILRISGAMPSLPIRAFRCMQSGNFTFIWRPYFLHKNNFQM